MYDDLWMVHRPEKEEKRAHGIPKDSWAISDNPMRWKCAIRHAEWAMTVCYWLFFISYSLPACPCQNNADRYSTLNT